MLSVSSRMVREASPSSAVVAPDLMPFFAVGVECQRPGAAEGDGRAVLAFDDGIFGVFVTGIRFIIVRGGVGQDIFRSVCGDDDDFARFVAGDRRSVGACQAQTAQDQPHTGCALLNFN